MGRSASGGAGGAAARLAIAHVRDRRAVAPVPAVKGVLISDGRGSWRGACRAGGMSTGLPEGASVQGLIVPSVRRPAI